MKRHIIALSICIMAITISHAQSLINPSWASRPVCIPSGIQITIRGINYDKNDSCVYFREIIDNSSGMGPLQILYHQLTNGDPVTFVELTDMEECRKRMTRGLVCHAYGRDKNHVYWKNSLINDSDLQSPVQPRLHLGCFYGCGLCP